MSEYEVHGIGSAPVGQARRCRAKFGVPAGRERSCARGVASAYLNDSNSEPP